MAVDEVVYLERNRKFGKLFLLRVNGRILDKRSHPLTSGKYIDQILDITPDSGIIPPGTMIIPGFKVDAKPYIDQNIEFVGYDFGLERHEELSWGEFVKLGRPFELIRSLTYFPGGEQ